MVTLLPICSSESVNIARLVKQYSLALQLTLQYVHLSALKFWILLFSESTYWSKDIIFLFSQHEFVGLQAWLDGYLGMTTSKCEFIMQDFVFRETPNLKRSENCAWLLKIITFQYCCRDFHGLQYTHTATNTPKHNSCSALVCSSICLLYDYISFYADIEAGSVEGRGGLLQAAINLEFEALRFGGISVLTEGLNGQLPNLDLVNVINKLIRDANIPPAIHGRVGILARYIV